MKPFNYQLARKGLPVCTTHGLTATFLTELDQADKDRCLAFIVTYKNGDQVVIGYDINGSCGNIDLQLYMDDITYYIIVETDRRTGSRNAHPDMFTVREDAVAYMQTLDHSDYVRYDAMKISMHYPELITPKIKKYEGNISK